MAKHVIKTNRTGTVDVKADADVWVLSKGVDVSMVGGPAFSNGSGFDNINYQIDGEIHVDAAWSAAGIHDAGDDISILIGKTGRVVTPTGLDLDGLGATVENHGTIQASDLGVGFTEDGFLLENWGKISGGNFSVGVVMASGKIVNQQDGVIKGTMTFMTDDTASETIVNKGKIDNAGDMAIFLSAGDDTLVNKGVINGIVALSGGDDIADLRGGVMSGEIDGGAGNDVFIINDASIKIVESNALGGIDMVKTSVSYNASAMTDHLIERYTAIGQNDIALTGNALDNTILGNVGTNKLSGLGGEDNLSGGKGNDILIGGADSDRFIFTTDGGTDRIKDFDPDDADADLIQLNFIPGIEDFDDVLDHMSFNGNTILDFGDGNKVVIEGVGDLGEQHFKIVSDIPFP
jgi:Ca2+-binding RTX toxin-like protein